MTTIHIACASDDRYMAHTAAMLHSVRWHAPAAPLHVHFLCGREPAAASRAKLQRMAADLGFRLDWVEVPEPLMTGLPGRGYLSRVVWYRIFMPELLPQLERVLYLDGDVIAMDSLEPLWGIAFEDAFFAAVTNVVPQYFANRAAILGLPGPGSYFNLGVALWNLSALRAQRFTENVLAHARAHPDNLWLEQDAVNSLYWARRRPLHPRWNVQNAMVSRVWGVQFLDPAELEEAIARPGFVHFEGSSFGKPWHLLSAHPLRERYYFHRRHTPWPFVIPEGITPKNLVKRFAPRPLVDWLRQRRR